MRAGYASHLCYSSIKDILVFIAFGFFSAIAAASDSQSLKQVQMLAEQGDIESQIDLGLMYRNGNSVKKAPPHFFEGRSSSGWFKIDVVSLP